MEFLNNKYISPDEIKNIAYKTSPKGIISFCQVNTTTKRICRSASFWHTYINDDQEKYNKLMMQLAVEGNLELFVKFWANGPLRPSNIVSDPVLLSKLFEKAVLNGNRYMAAYIYVLDRVVDVDSDDENANDTTKQPINVYDELENLYSLWEINLKDVMFSKGMISMEFIVTFTYLIKKDQIDEAINLLEIIPEKTRFYLFIDALSWCKDISILDLLLNKLTTMNVEFDDRYLESIIQTVLVNGNFKLAKQLLARIPTLRIYLPLACRSNSPNTLKFIKNNLTNREIIEYDGPIINKEFAYYIIDRVSDDEEDQAEMIFRSWKAFTPQEYVDLIMDYMGCVTLEEHDRIITVYLKSSEYYAAKVFFEQIPVCDIKE